MTTMTTDTMTADEAQRLLDGREAKGRWRTGTVEHEGKVWAHDPDALGGASVGEVCIFLANKHYPHNGNRALCAAAPRLAASVIALHAQLAQVTAERDALRANSGRWRDLFVALYETMSGDADVTDDSPDAIHNGLSAEVIRLQDAADETRRATEARDDAADTYDILVRAAWEAATGDTHEGPASVEVLLDAVRGLRSIVEGRTTPPTIEEARAHIDAGGVFRMVCGTRVFTAESMIAVDVAIEDFPGGRWWALDAQRRPCAWPGGR